MRAATFPAALLLALLARSAAADSWTAPQPQVAVSEDGRWYVIVQPKPRAPRDSDLLLVKAGPSTEPIPRSPEPSPSDEVRSLSPRTGDEVVAKGDGTTPMEVRCRDGGKGFVLFETWTSVGRRTAAAAYDGAGHLVWEKGLQDFFTAGQIAAFVHTASSIWWYSGLWLDEEAGDLVVLVKGPADRHATAPAVLRIALEDGSSRAGRPEDVVGRVGRGTEAEQVAALDVALALRPPGLAAEARKSIGRGDVPRAVRLRLAVVLAREGDAAGKDLLRVAAQEETEPRARAFATRHLPDALGVAALPVLREGLRASDDAWSESIDAFVALGPASVPVLVEMVGERAERSNYRGAAIESLGRIGKPARTALPALLAVVEESDPYLTRIGLDAAVAVASPEEVAPRVIPLLEKGTTEDELLAGFFEAHPSRAAVPALIAALARHEGDPDDFGREPILAALVQSSGATGIRPTAAAWRAWWATQR